MISSYIYNPFMPMINGAVDLMEMCLPIFSSFSSSNSHCLQIQLKLCPLLGPFGLTVKCYRKIVFLNPLLIKTNELFMSLSITKAGVGNLTKSLISVSELKNTKSCVIIEITINKIIIQVDMCGMCDTIIDGQYLTALENKFHPSCFVCVNCKSEIKPGQDFYERYGIP